LMPSSQHVYEVRPRKVRDVAAVRVEPRE
jgi:hypothetical protein